MFKRNNRVLELESRVLHLEQVLETIKNEFLEETSTLEELEGNVTVAARVAALYNHFDFGLEKQPRNPMFTVRVPEVEDEQDKK